MGKVDVKCGIEKEEKRGAPPGECHGAAEDNGEVIIQ